MEWLRSPKNKLIVLSVLMLALAGAASVNGLNPALGARWILGLCAAGGLGFWLWKQRQATAKFALAPRLSVLSRTGLSQRCGLALVEADGKTYLVVHGAGYAEVCEAVCGAKVSGRRPVPRRRRNRHFKLPGGSR